MNSLEITDKKNVIKKRMQEIISTCKKEIREMNEEEKVEFQSMKDENTKLNEELKALQEKLSTYEKELPTEEEVEEISSEEVDKENNTNKRNIKQNKMKQFRLLSAINDIANNRNLSDDAQKVVSMGIEEMRKSGISYSGQIVLPSSTRSITASGNAGVISEDIKGILEPLRAKNVLIDAGAQYMSGLVGDVSIPVMGKGNVQWATENGEAADAGITFTSVKLSPKRLTAFIDISKQFLIQTSADAEAKIRMDIVNAINAKLEETILSDAAGSATQPAGIFATVPTTTATTTTYKGIAKLNEKVDDANVINEKVYVMSNGAKSTFRTEPKATGSTAGFIIENMEIDGEKVIATSNVKANHFVYGDFSNLIIGEWSGVDLVVDPYTQASKGAVRLVVNAYFDAQVARKEAFATGKVA